MDPEENRREWANRADDYSPAYYARIGPNEVSETLGTVLEYYASEDDRILEVGCGSGRHLAHLRERGFEDLWGIDINDDAFEVMARHYPRLAQTGTFRTGALADLLPAFDDDAFDVVYSVETLQHVHPEDEWVFEDLVRVTRDLLVTAENGPGRGRSGQEVQFVDDEFPIFYRNWRQVFSERGLAQLLTEPGDRDTVRVFRVP
jgi:SAM-dependent methyltransferase